MNRMLFGMITAMVDGGGRRAASEPRRVLPWCPEWPMPETGWQGRFGHPVSWVSTVPSTGL
ncbi:hypothetical protein [Streptomyces yangpuensis]|uniref:hypothetical protein n=1 Tax=Streptomyces yangpuensis TaxID=1648182 RepID=UPI00371BF37B